MIDEDDVTAAQAVDGDSTLESREAHVSSALDGLERLDAVAGTGGPSRRERRRQRREARWTLPVRRDWRWGVRLVGRSLIILGLLMFGFVAYQLWGTGIETSRAQNRLENEFEEMLAEVQADDGGESSGANTDTDPSRSPGDDDLQNQPGQQGQDETTGQGGQEPAGATTDDAGAGQDGGDAVNDEPSGRVETVQVGDGPIRRDLPPVAAGEPLGKIEIPRIGLDFMVVEGVSTSNLKDGVGHYPDTPQPGQLGNSSIAGHRTTYGNPFLHVDELEAGDQITVTSLAGTFVYNVTDSFVVGPSDYWVVGTEDEDVASLTLTTCHPAWSSSQRLVITAELDPDASDRMFIADPVDETEADDEVTDDDQNGTEDPDDPVMAGDDNAADDDETASAAPGGANFVPSEGGVDAFAQGWFSDSGAFPHVALWGLVLAALATIGYLISRYFRRYWVGTLVCVTPFLVALYFFYQNVNRLLPPAL